ncbi:MAG: hypothetical protein ACK53L_33475, partial [Pirellulaceae bacterium]
IEGSGDDGVGFTEAGGVEAVMAGRGAVGGSKVAEAGAPRGFCPATDSEPGKAGGDGPPQGAEVAALLDGELAAVGAAGTDVATFPPVAKGGVANGEGAGSIPGVEGAVGNALLLNGSGGSGSPEGKAGAVFAPGIVGG